MESTPEIPASVQQATANLSSQKTPFTRSLAFKVMTMGLLILLLMIPLIMVRSTISERQSLRSSAENEISSMWGGAQMVAPPILHLPWIYRFGPKLEEVLDKNAYILPSKSVIEGDVKTETRYRGIHKVLVYTADLVLKGEFKRPNFGDLGFKQDEAVLSSVDLGFAVQDMVGLKQIQVNIAGEERAYTPDQLESHFHSGGLRIPVPLTKETLASTGPFLPYTIRLKINGTGSLMFLPFGESNLVRVRSDWNSPSFDGIVLPEKREISERGFVAEWNVLNLARPYPQWWTTKAPVAETLRASGFGAKFMIPVDVYSQSERSIKYGFLFLFLTFVTMFIIEVLGRVQVHPMQYVLIGSGLVLFYLLLLSLSEHIGFLPSYLVASAAVVGLITLYSKVILSKRSYILTVGGLLTGLYAFLFVLLQEEDYALLMGSIGLFAILAVVMYATRKLNWYEIKADTPTALTRTS